MDGNSHKIAFLERKLSLLDEERKAVLAEIKKSKKSCNHKYLVGGIVTNYDEIYYCLCCGNRVAKTKEDAKVMIDVKDYFTAEEYGSHEFYIWFEGYYDIAKKRLNNMLVNGIPEELYESTLTTELVHYLKENRRDRGR